MSQQRPNQSSFARCVEEGAVAVVVPLDGAAESQAALPAAFLIAWILRADVRVVHARDRPMPPEVLLGRLGLSPEEARGIVVDQVLGTPANAIVDDARTRHAAMIVMTTRGHTTRKDQAIGPVTAAVIARAPCPVLLVRPEIASRVAAMTGLYRILLPLDGAPSSARVIGPALQLAWQSGAELDVIYVATLTPRPEEPGTLTVPFYVDQPQHEWPAWGQEFTRRFGTCLGQIQLPASTRLFLRRGDPGQEILRFAVDHWIDLIALEWRGRLDPNHASVVREVLANAPCPVLLLRTT